MNEPIVTPATAQMEELKKAGKSNRRTSSTENWRGAARPTTPALPVRPSKRLQSMIRNDLVVVTDKYKGGTAPIPAYSAPRSCRVAIPTIQYS